MMITMRRLHLLVLPLLLDLLLVSGSVHEELPVCRWENQVCSTIYQQGQAKKNCRCGASGSCPTAAGDDRTIRDGADLHYGLCVPASTFRACNGTEHALEIRDGLTTSGQKHVTVQVLCLCQGQDQESLSNKSKVSRGPSDKESTYITCADLVSGFDLSAVHGTTDMGNLELSHWDNEESRVTSEGEEKNKGETGDKKEEFKGEEGEAEEDGKEVKRGENSFAFYKRTSGEGKVGTFTEFYEPSSRDSPYMGELVDPVYQRSQRGQSSFYKRSSGLDKKEFGRDLNAFYKRGEGRDRTAFYKRAESDLSSFYKRAALSAFYKRNSAGLLSSFYKKRGALYKKPGHLGISAFYKRSAQLSQRSTPDHVGRDFENNLERHKRDVSDDSSGEEVMDAEVQKRSVHELSSFYKKRQGDVYGFYKRSPHDDLSGFYKRSPNHVLAFYKRAPNDISAFYKRSPGDLNAFYKRSPYEFSSFYKRSPYDHSSFYKRVPNDLSSFYKRASNDVSSFYKRGSYDVSTFYKRAPYDESAFYKRSPYDVSSFYKRSPNDVSAFYKRSPNNINAFYKKSLENLSSFYKRRSGDGLSSFYKRQAQSGNSDNERQNIAQDQQTDLYKRDRQSLSAFYRR